MRENNGEWREWERKNKNERERKKVGEGIRNGERMRESETEGEKY